LCHFKVPEFKIFTENVLTVYQKENLAVAELTFGHVPICRLLNTFLVYSIFDGLHHPERGLVQYLRSVQRLIELCMLVFVFIGLYYLIFGVER